MGLLCTTCHKVETTLNMQREITENRKEKKKKLMTKTTNFPDGTVDGNLSANSGDRVLV